MLDGCALTAKPGTALLPLVRRRQGKCLTDVPWRQKPGTALSSLDRRRQGKCLDGRALTEKTGDMKQKKKNFFGTPRHYRGGLSYPLPTLITCHYRRVH